MEKQAAVQLATGLTQFSEPLMPRPSSIVGMAKVCLRYRCFSSRKCPERKRWEEGKQLLRVKELQINRHAWLMPPAVWRWSDVDEGGSIITLICFC